MVQTAQSVLSQAKELIECDLLESAEVLCAMHLSSAGPLSADSVLIMEMRADILAMKHEYQRALAVYHRIEASKRGARKNTDSTHVKMAKCYLQLSDYSSALKELRKTGVRSRDASGNILLAKLYKLSGLKEQAVSALKDALKVLPFAVEIIEDLIGLGVKCADIYEAVRKRVEVVDGSLGEWALLLLKAVLSRRDCEYPTCVESLLGLQALFPGNAYVLYQLAYCYSQMEHSEQALSVFRSLRSTDAYCLRGMDSFAHLLFSHKRGEAELCRLASDLMAIDGGHVVKAQSWAVASMYAERKGDHEKAILFIENAIKCHPHYAFAYRFKGLLHLNHSNYESAIVCFRQSNSLHKDVHTYAGLVKAHLDLAQVKDANLCCKDAIEFAPKSAVAYMLLGKLLEKAPQKQLESLRAYNNALRLNPSSCECAVGKAEILATLDRRDEAIETLKLALNENSTVALRIMLGKMYAETGMFAEALDQLQWSLSASDVETGSATEAQEEIDRIESIVGRQGEEHYDEEYELDDRYEIDNRDNGSDSIEI